MLEGIAPAAEDWPNTRAIDCVAGVAWSVKTPRTDPPDKTPAAANVANVAATTAATKPPATAMRFLLDKKRGVNLSSGRCMGEPLRSSR
jgi:hypothetical protein